MKCKECEKRKKSRRFIITVLFTILFTILVAAVFTFLSNNVYYGLLIAVISYWGMLSMRG